MTASNTLDFQNFYSTTLAQTCTAGDTTIYLNSLPTPTEGYIVIEPDNSSNREIIYYNAKGANYVTCPASGRGVGGTTAVGHSSGVTVQMNNIAELWRDLQTGQSNTGMHQYFNDSFSDYVQSGIAITQATGLIASISSGIVYINGRRLTTSATSKTFTASKDTYVDVYTTDTSNTATYSFTELASGATGSVPVANGIHTGFVNTSASVIGTVSQQGFDVLTNPIKNNFPYPLGTNIQVVDSLYSAVATGTTVIPLDDTIPQNTEGDQYMTCSITPRSATSKLTIDVIVWGTHTANFNAIATLFKDNDVNAMAVSDSYFPSASVPANIKLYASVIAGTTSQITFKVRCGSAAAGTFTFNGLSGARYFGATPKSSIVIREYTQ